MKKFILLSLAGIIVFGSCSRIFYGDKGVVKFESDPPGAEIIIEGKNTGKRTPAEIDIVKENYVKARRTSTGSLPTVKYQLKKDNYVDVVDIIESKTNPLLYLDQFLIIPLYYNNYGAQFKAEVNKTLERSNTVATTDTVVVQEIVYVETGSGIQKYQFEKKSDVNKNIPHQAPQKPKRFALIIGNEDYSSQQIGLSSEVDVHFARNDASAFKEYAMKVLGVPERNITFLLDATTGQMNQAIARMNAITRSTYGEAEIFVYYAGHGLPDEKTREAYIMPVDVSGKNATNGIKLNDMYKRLTEHPSKRVTVFIDACFSGGAREQGLLAARAVMVRPRANVLDGNLVVFAGSSGEESALPYKEQHHGFFTYFLLKALKEKGPNVTYGELADHLIKTIELESILVNEKEQTPRVNVSPSVQNKWENWTFN